MRDSNKKQLYTFALGSLRLRFDYKGDPRSHLGVSPYSKRSPMLLAAYNMREMVTFLLDRSDAKFFRSATRALRNSKKDSQALVLGNGPSLSRLDAKAVERDNPDIWVVNDFYKVKQAEDLTVTHYAISDRVYFSDSPGVVNARLKPILEYVKRKNAILVLPHWASTLDLPIPSSIQTYFFDDRELSAWSSNTSPIRPRGYIGLTLYKTLAFALYLGYDKVFLLGMDNTEFLNYGSDKSNRILLSSNHAYENFSNAADLSDHFADGMASVFTSLAHTFGDLLKFKGPVFNLDEYSLTTRFPKLTNQPWISSRRVK